ERCDLLERVRSGETVLEGNGLNPTEKNDDANRSINYCNTGTLLFKKPILWDTELIVNGTRHYKAHRAILSVHSGYFKALFEKDDLKTPAEIQLQANDLPSFHTMFKFLYTGIIPSSLEYKQLKLLLQIANT
ncbi:unnamed protein product, partial [Rotaria magnacalcarata]